MTDTCHECGNEYQKLALHWSLSDCSHKKFSDHQHEILTGLVLGDASVKVNSERQNPRVYAVMITKEYLEYLSIEAFPHLSSEVRLEKTAEESVEQSKRNGVNENAKIENYHDVYRWYTMSNPELNTYRDWYKTGSKVFPSDIELTPTTLKHYYVGDGTFEQEEHMASISICNEAGNGEKIVNMFERVGFENFTWSCWERDNGYTEAQIRFGVPGTDNFFDYIGRDPLPGFGYKFP